MHLNILVDADIPGIRETFSPYGQVRAVPGHEIDRAEADWADVLVVRTVTRVDRELLTGTPVQFVASATAGVDHVDHEWLREAGIGFASAAGANAGAVTDYVLSALGVAIQNGALEGWPHVTIGIVGYGHVGMRLARRLERIGCRVLACDPPKAETGTMDRPSVPLSDVLEQVDALSLHTSLTRAGAWPSKGLLTADALARLPEAAVIVQTSRGGVLDDQEAAQRRRRGELAFLALDVWEHEPVPGPDVMAVADLATPHIAGYSSSAKWQGVQMVAGALAVHLGVCPRPPAAAPDANEVLTVDRDWPGPAEAFSWLTRRLYDIQTDDAMLREAIQCGASNREMGERFHSLRAQYGTRPGYDAYNLQTDDLRWRALFEAVTRDDWEVTAC